MVVREDCFLQAANASRKKNEQELELTHRLSQKFLDTHTHTLLLLDFISDLLGNSPYKTYIELSVVCLHQHSGIGVPKEIILDLTSSRFN